VRGRVTVVSPHLDDAVLSLGAAIARWTRGGAAVDVVTVFAGDTESTRPASKWDRRAGFETEGSAVRARREEDWLACSLVGAQPVWLPLAEAAYEAAHDAAAVRSALSQAVAGADAVLLPGPPLDHPDHAWLAALPPGDDWRGRIGVYLAQPYAFRAAGRAEASSAGQDEPRWQHVRVGARDRRAKWRAARAYRSQLPLLGLARPAHIPLLRLLWFEARSGGEALAWLPSRSTTLSGP
jgi:LmbE family N-acetylglucosaminyl deacetylase